MRILRSHPFLTNFYEVILSNATILHINYMLNFNDRIITAVQKSNAIFKILKMNETQKQQAKNGFKNSKHPNRFNAINHS